MSAVLLVFIPSFQECFERCLHFVFDSCYCCLYACVFAVLSFVGAFMTLVCVVCRRGVSGALRFWEESAVVCVGLCVLSPDPFLAVLF